MAGALQRTIAGDLEVWPAPLRRAAQAATAAARPTHDSGAPRRAQSAAYAAAHAALLAGEVEKQLSDRLARQLGMPPATDLPHDMVAPFQTLSPRSAFLAIRGSANAICSGARLQIEGAQCVFCGAAPDALAHFVLCASALGPFCAALGVPTHESLRLALEAEPRRAPAIWAAFLEFVSVVAAARSDVVARGDHFVPSVAAASVRAILQTSVAKAKAQARRRRPARALVAPPRP